MPRPIIDYSKCTSCGTCVEVCPANVFGKVGDKVLVKKPKDCIGCRACEAQCPAEAIVVKDGEEEEVPEGEELAEPEE